MGKLQMRVPGGARARRQKAADEDVQMGDSAATLRPGTVFGKVVEAGKTQGAWKIKWFGSGINPGAGQSLLLHGQRGAPARGGICS